MRQRTIKSEILRINILYSLLIMIVLGGCLSFLFYQTRTEQITRLLRANNHAINSLLESAFDDAKSTVSFLSELDIVRNHPQNDPARTKELLTFYNSIRSTNNRIDYLYSGYAATNEIVITDWKVPEGFRIESRPWYSNAVHAFPNAATGMLYKEYKSQNWLISTSKVFLNSDGAFAGVVSYDMKLDYILSLIAKQHDSQQQSYSYVFRKTGQITVHPDPERINQNFFQVTDGIEPTNLTANEGLLSYYLQDKKLIGYYSCIPGTDWIIATAISKYDIFWQFFLQAALCFAVVLVTSISWALWQSKNTLAKIIHPLHQLQEQMESLVSGSPSAVHDWNYPNNEIGNIAGHAAELAQNELMAKNAALKTLNCELEQANQALQVEKQNLELVSNTDQLTQVDNRRSLDWHLSQEFNRTHRYGQPLTMLMIDLDRFKQINDLLGHMEGDKVLIEVARVIKANVRETDILGRWGGEEFMILCPNTDLQGGEASATHIWDKVRNHAFSPNTRVTISVGVSQLQPGQTIDSLIRTTDANLYEAKASGRDRIISK